MKFTLSSESDKHSRIKMALIPILVLLLVYVLTSSEQPAPVNAPVRQSSIPARKVPTTPPESKANLQSSFVSSRPQPSLSLNQILAHDPFRKLPTLINAEKEEEKILISQSTTVEAESSPAETVEREEEILNRIKENLKQQVISGILYGPESKAAIINARSTTKEICSKKGFVSIRSVLMGFYSKSTR